MGDVGDSCSQVEEPGLHQIVEGGWEGDLGVVGGRVRGRCLWSGGRVSEVSWGQGVVV